MTSNLSQVIKLDRYNIGYIMQFMIANDVYFLQLVGSNNPKYDNNILCYQIVINGQLQPHSINANYLTKMQFESLICQWLDETFEHNSHIQFIEL